MSRRFIVATATVVAAMAIGAAAPAFGTTAKTVLSTSLEEVLEPTGRLVGTLHGETSVQSQHYCEVGRKIELFLDGKKVGTTESDRYGGWYFSLVPLKSGRYVAKTKKSQLSSPAKVVCSAAQSKPVVVP